MNNVLLDIYKNITTWLGSKHNDIVLSSICLSLWFPMLKGIEDCYNGLKKDPGNGDLHFVLYNLLKFDPENSYYHLDKAVENVPEKYSFMYFSEGSEAFNSGDYSKAIKYLWKYIKYTPEDRDSYSLLAESYRCQNKLNTSVRVLNMGLKIFPDYPLYYILMGSSYLNIANVKRALTCFSKAAELGSELQEVALLKIGLSYIILGEYDKTIEIWNELIKLYPDSLKGYYSLGFIYLETGNKEKAFKYFKRCLEIGAELKEKIKEHI